MSDLYILDISNGWLMKIDSFANIQLSTVYGNTMSLHHKSWYIYAVFHLTAFHTWIVGREPIKDTNDVIKQHRGVHISPDYLQKNMYQLNDLFSIPQVQICRLDELHIVHLLIMII